MASADVGRLPMFSPLSLKLTVSDSPGRKAPCANVRVSLVVVPISLMASQAADAACATPVPASNCNSTTHIQTTPRPSPLFPATADIDPFPMNEGGARAGPSPRVQRWVMDGDVSPWYRCGNGR